MKFIAQRRTEILLFAAIILALTSVSKAQLEAPDGPPRARMDRLERRISEYERNLTREEKLADFRLAVARLRLEKARLLTTRYIWGVFLAEAVNDELAMSEKLAEGLGQPLDGFGEPGRRELAYISPIDLSPEPFIVYAPTGYDGEKPHPLLIFLHGYDYYIDKANWLESMYSPAMEELAENNGYIVAMPYGRSNTEFMGIGEQDVLKVLELMKKFYRIDERRVIISGASMGGSGAYTIAAHHPHLFAGAFSISHRADFYFWMGVEKEAFPPFKRIQVDTDYVSGMLENFLNLPVFMFHGELDRRPYPHVEQSRRMYAQLREMGQSAKYHEFPGQGHFIWSDAFLHPELAPWMNELRAPEYPRRVAYRTMTLKYNRAYWVEIEAMERWGEQARVFAEALDGNRISLQTANVARLALRPGPLVEQRRPVTFIVNGDELGELTADEDGVFRLTLAPHVPGRADLRKTPEMCGPVREAYAGPFIFVYGTAGTPEETQDNRRRALTAAQEWIRYAQGRASVSSDREVTEEDIENNNLILFGSPQSNGILARMAGELPIKIEPQAYVVGGRRVEREGRGLMMIYPNPLNPLRYIVVRDGPDWGGALAINHRLTLAPDFIIYTEQIDRSGTIFDFLQDIVATNRHVCAGYFDVDWQLSDRLTWWGE